MERQCKKCLLVKNINEFAVRTPKYPNIRFHQCKKCRLRPKSKNKAVFLKFKYGLTLDQWDELLQKQNGVCKICLEGPENKGKGKFHVDHCHKTGVVRGLLCHNCNVSLGLLKERIDIIERLLKYVQAS